MNILVGVGGRRGEASSRIQAQLACHMSAVPNRTSYLNVRSTPIRHSCYLDANAFVQVYSRKQTISSR
jgi:hypothetical protein